MAKYSRIDKLIHSLYLSNRFLSKASFEIEEALFGQKSKKQEVTQKVFVTGLARSGTTAFMRTLFETSHFASLQYNNMPFLLTPNLWKNSKETQTQERAHQDSILINQKSPEAFDEYFWKVFLKNNYIKNALLAQEIPLEILQKYESYISLICYAKGKKSYLSKNNNTILRLKTVTAINNSTVFLLFRKPLDHAASLLKQHLSFIKQQKEDPFVLDYFNYLGHHEFGLGHKPFLLDDLGNKIFNSSALDDINYWLLQWKKYYRYIKDNSFNNLHLIAFEDIIKHPEKIYQKVLEKIQLSSTIETKQYKPKSHTTSNVDQILLQSCQRIYDTLLENKRRLKP